MSHFKLEPALVGGFAFIRGGFYNISALAHHPQPVYSLLGKTMHFSVRARAGGIEVHRLDDLAQIERGGVCCVSHCVQCHGGPGVAQDPIGRSLLPPPGPLVEASRKWRPQDLYWITRNGIKMSGMPSWRFTMAEADLWAVVAFMQRLPALALRLPLDSRGRRAGGSRRAAARRLWPSDS